MQYCSLHHRTLLPSPVTSTTGCCFCFGSASSFFQELFLHSSPVAYCIPTDLESSSFSVISFCLFILFMIFSRQECWSGLPFPSPGHHNLSELSTMTRLFWVDLHGMAQSFIQLDKAVIHVISLVSFLWLWFSFYLSLVDEDKRSVDTPGTLVNVLSYLRDWATLNKKIKSSFRSVKPMSKQSQNLASELK